MPHSNKKQKRFLVNFQQSTICDILDEKIGARDTWIMLKSLYSNDKDELMHKSIIAFSKKDD